MSRLLYLSGPIDHYDGDHAWRDEVHHALLDETGWVMFDPFRAFTVAFGTEPDTQIASINRMALASANGCVAYLPDVITHGVPMEIEFFLSRGLPVSIVGGVSALNSWMLVGAHVAQSFEEAIAYVIGKSSDRSLDHPDKLKVMAINGKARIPTQANPGDAAWDLYCIDTVTINPGEMKDLRTGLAIEPRPGVWHRIVGRSSLYRNYKLLAVEGIIDTGYRGELFAAVINMGDKPYRVKEGDRVCQLIPMVNLVERTVIEEVNVLRPSQRGAKGYGSTGV